MTDIEQVITHLKALENKVQIALNNDLSWGQKHWGWVTAGALLVGVLLGAMIG